MPQSDPSRLDVEQVYARLAADYDRRWAGYLRRSHDVVLSSLKPHLEAGTAVLELGCGTGALLGQLHAEQPSLNLTGLDLTREMLAVARRRLPNSVRLVQGDFARVPFGQSQFDCVVTCNALHYTRQVAQPAEQWHEWRRVLRPGGRVVLSDWRGEAWTNQMRERWLRWRGRTDVRALKSRQCQELFEATGFDDVRVSFYRAGWHWPMMLLTAKRRG